MNIVSLFDESGNAVRDWATAGFQCYCFDLLNEDRVEGNITYVKADLYDPQVHVRILNLNPKLISAFPPCTDLANSGSRHWARKSLIDPSFQQRAVDLARLPERLANILHVPFYIENPMGRLSTLWRKPDFKFNPFEYGGYLPEDDVHPRFSKYIAPRDAYPKLTGIWCGNGFKIPAKKPVIRPPGYATQHTQLGGGMKIAAKVRSETPRGWARAVFEANR